eukprot:7394061-Pyramimonas_sp.AAC.1
MQSGANDARTTGPDWGPAGNVPYPWARRRPLPGPLPSWARRGSLQTPILSQAPMLVPRPMKEL